MASGTEKCPICMNELRNPRLLPCIHSFCLECLEQYCRDKLPGDDVPCPVCRTEFEIPKDGVAGLLVRAPVKEREPAEVCEACSTDHAVIPATVYCVDCSQKLCKRCSVPHMKWRGGPHDVRKLDAVPCGYRGGSQYCEEHKERFRMYCFDCQIILCSTCCIEAHKTHKFEKIDSVAEEFATSIDYEIQQVTSRVECFRGAVAQAEDENSKLLGNIQTTEQEIKVRGADVKLFLSYLIDDQVSELLQELQLLKSAAEKEVKSHTDTLQLAMTELESFRTSSLEVRLKGSPSDITQAANGVCNRAKELLDIYIIPGQYHAPSYTLTPVNIDELLRDGQNFVGHVVKGKDSGNVSCYYRTVSATALFYSYRFFHYRLQTQTYLPQGFDARTSYNRILL